MFGDFQAESDREDGDGAPRLEAPFGAVDCHMRVYGPRERYPLVEEPWFEPPERSVEDYRAVRDRLGLDRAVVVQPTVYGFDNDCSRDAVAALRVHPDMADADQARGIATLRPDITERALEELTAAGFIGARCQMDWQRRLLDWEDLDRLAWRVHDHDWVIDLRMDGDDLVEVEQQLREWPGWVVLNHMGDFGKPIDLNTRGFKALTRLIDRDRVWVKLSAPYLASRTGGPDYPDIAEQARALVRWAPERMVWGSNWPHPELIEQPPGDAALLDLLLDWADGEATRERILCRNPELLYRFPSV